MKKSLFYIMLIAFVAMPLTSCEKDPQKPEGEKQHDPQSDEDQRVISGYDGLEYFQNSIVVLDKKGNPERRIYGQILDPSDTTILSVCVSNLEMAKDIFLSWMTPDKRVTTMTDNYDYYMTDRDGKPQGSVSFSKADSNDGGVLATVTVGDNTDLKCFTQINFVSGQAWPENAANQKFEYGQTYVIRANVLRMDQNPVQPNDWYWDDGNLTCMVPYPKDLTFFCIQENTNGKEAILVHLSPDANDSHAHGRPKDYVDYNAYKQCASLPEAEKVLKYYTDYYEFWEAMIDTMEEKGETWDWHYGVSTTGNEEFILNSYNEKDRTIKVLDLDSQTGKIVDVALDSWFNYRYIYVRTFPPYVAE